MNGYNKESGVTTKLPSFQQLVQGFQEPDLVSPTTNVHPSEGNNQRVHLYSPYGKLTPTNYSNYTLSTGEYYHHHHDNSQYFPPGINLGTNVKSARASPTAMNRGRSLSFSYGAGQTPPVQDILESGVINHEYQFIPSLTEFLIEFEKKYHDLKVNYNNGDLTTIYKIFQDFQDLDDAITNCKRVIEILENIKILNEKTRVKRRDAATAANAASATTTTTATTTNKRIDKKNHKRKVKSSSEGEISLEINVQTSSSSPYGHQSAGMGGLNPELSLKPEITCQHCCSQETPEWRRGPEGSRTLCNACGLFYSKLIKKYGLQEADKVMYQRKQTGTVNDRRIF